MAGDPPLLARSSRGALPPCRATTPPPRAQYGRYDNPTWRNLEAALGELEGGEALVFASGMAAITAVLQTLLRPGDTLVVPADGY